MRVGSTWVTDTLEAKERALRHSIELQPSAIFHYISTDIFLQVKPTVPRNISAIRAEIWEHPGAVIWEWLRQHDAVLRPLVGAPAPRWQHAPKTWSPSPMWQATTTAIISEREAKTTRERVVYQWGRAIQATTVMEDVMVVMEWSVVLPVCEQPRQALPSNPRLHRLLVSLLDIRTQAEAPLHLCLQDVLRVTTLPQLQATSTEDPTMVWHRS